MQTKYEKIMDRVRVTDEMRSRILHTLETAEADMAAQPDSKVTSLSRWKQLHKSVAVAACVVMGAYTVRLKGESGRYTLGTWTDGTYSYSLQLSNGQTQDVWQAMIESMK